ncbi:hypothetical protein [Geomonas edaphica]
MLKSMGRFEEIDHITTSPTVVCFTCGVEANSPENVCNPMPLEK